MKNKSITKRKIIAYFEVLFVFFITMLFLTAHYLLTIFYQSSSSEDIFWMGIEVNNSIIDIALYSAIFLTAILVMLIIHRNFDLKKKKVRL